MRDSGYAHIDFENKEGKSIEISLPPGYNRLVIGITPYQDFVEEVIEGSSDAGKSKKPRLREEARDALDGQSRLSNEYSNLDFTQSGEEDNDLMPQNFVEKIIEGRSDADKSKRPQLRDEARDALDSQSLSSNEYNKPNFTRSDKEDRSPCQEILRLRTILNGNIKGHLELIFKEHLGIEGDMLKRLKNYGNVELLNELFGKHIQEKKQAGDLIDFLNQRDSRFLKKMQSNNSQNTVDVLVITALPKELKALRNVRGFGNAEWKEELDSKEDLYYVGRFECSNGSFITIAAASTVDTGGIDSVELATRLSLYLKPKCLAMTGICAGDRKEVFLGDVIVAKQVFKFDYGKAVACYSRGESGEEIRHEDIELDSKSILLDDRLLKEIQEFIDKWEGLGKDVVRPKSMDYQKRWFLHRLHDFEENVTQSDPLNIVEDWFKRPVVLEQLINQKLVSWNADNSSLKLTEKGESQVKREKIIEGNKCKPDNEQVAVHLASIGTSDKVMKDKRLFEILRKMGTGVRKVYGVEMEGSVISRVAFKYKIPSLIIKSVSDYGDDEKDDEFHTYASASSANFLIDFLTQTRAIDIINDV